MSIKFSIILPVYNGEKYITETIKSVIQQTYANWELIIINDASTDHTLDIVQQYTIKNPKIKVYTNTKNCRIGISRNLGISKASGNYLMFLDADDTYTPDLLNNLEKILRTKLYDIVVFPFNYISGQKTGCYLKRRNSGPFNISDYDISSSCVMWNMAYRKDFINNYQIRCGEKCPYMGEDLIFVIPALFKATSLYYLNEIGIIYRIYNESGSHRKRSINSKILDDDFVIFSWENEFRRLGIYNNKHFNWLVSVIPMGWSISFFPLMNRILYKRAKNFFKKSNLTENDYKKYGHMDVFLKYQKILRYPYEILYIKYVIKCFFKSLKKMLHLKKKKGLR